MAAKFGTSGLRGLATELVGFEARRHVLAFLRHVKAEVSGKICVAWDYRASTPEILHDVRVACAAHGVAMMQCGEVPTPALAAFAMKRGLASIMITGSHIPADRNGIKFYLSTGEILKPDEVAIQKLASEISEGAFANEDKCPVEDVSPTAREEFLSRFTSTFSSTALLGMRIGVYQHSTVARDLLVSVLEQLGAEAVALGRSDTFIPVDTEAVSDETRAKLKTWASQHSFHAIVSADGDGDRPLVANEFGDVVPGDVLGLIASKYLQAKCVVSPVTANSGLDAALGFPVLRTRVGSPYVIDAMQAAVSDRRDKVVGFEANGGFLTMSPLKTQFGVIAPLPTRDCFLPILAVLAQANALETSVADLVQSSNLTATMSDRIEHVPTQASAKLIERLRASRNDLRDFFSTIGDVIAVNEIDGLRLNLDNGQVVHFRPSGNAPEFRIYVEAATIAEALTLLDSARAAVLASPELRGSLAQ
jgi:phosphomannomutase